MNPTSVKEKLTSRSNAIATALIAAGMAGFTNAIESPPDDYMVWTFGAAALVTMSRHLRDVLIAFVSAKYNDGKSFDKNFMSPFNTTYVGGHADDTRGE